MTFRCILNIDCLHYIQHAGYLLIVNTLPSPEFHRLEAVKLVVSCFMYVPLSSALLTGKLFMDPTGFRAKAWHKLFIIVIIPLTTVSFRGSFAARPLDGRFAKHWSTGWLVNWCMASTYQHFRPLEIKSTCLCVMLLVSVHTPQLWLLTLPQWLVPVTNMGAYSFGLGYLHHCLEHCHIYAFWSWRGLVLKHQTVSFWLPLPTLFQT